MTEDKSGVGPPFGECPFCGAGPGEPCDMTDPYVNGGMRPSDGAAGPDPGPPSTTPGEPAT